MGEGEGRSELVEDDQRMARRVLEDGTRLLQLHAERRQPRHDGVIRADACEDAVDRRERARDGRHVAAKMRD